MDCVPRTPDHSLAQILVEKVALLRLRFTNRLQFRSFGLENLLLSKSHLQSFLERRTPSPISTTFIMTQKGGPPKHAWSSATLDSDGGDLTKVVDQASAPMSSAAALFLPVEEAERLVESLERVGVEGVGSRAYLKYFNNLQTLNLSAHSHAQVRSAEERRPSGVNGTSKCTAYSSVRNVVAVAKTLPFLTPRLARRCRFSRHPIPCLVDAVKD